jgi:CO/xanthine dehydrogenase Mo-binding subunit
MLTSPYAHAEITYIDTSRALASEGVAAVLTGRECSILTGPIILDRPPVAVDKVRYFGEPVAIVVADTEEEAQKGAGLIKVGYKPLPVVNSPGEAAREGAALVHERLDTYRLLEEAFPQPGTNIANSTRIRKGSMEEGWAQSQVTVEERFSFPQSDHGAMETRCAAAQVFPDGRTVIYTSSQAPFDVKKLLSIYLHLDPGKVIVRVPFVGGAYGGKTPMQLEIIAYLASKAAGGRMVKVTNTREEDMAASPVHIGLKAVIKLGCTIEGYLKAEKVTFLFDGGAYSDRAIVISKAAAVDCTTDSGLKLRS